MPNSVQGKQLRIARCKYDEKSRIFAVAFVRFFQQICRLQTTLFEGDIDLVIVGGAVAIASIESRMREADFRKEFASANVVVGTERQRGCNALSVAEATGLPRETVRRKIKRLIKLGILARRGVGDYVLQPGVLLSPPFVTLFRDLSDQTIRLVNECLDEEVFTTVSRCP